MSTTTFFLSAGEPSGDLHAAKLIASIRRQSPGAQFVGLGGPLMAAEGCELLRDMTVHGSHMLLAGPLMEIGSYLKLVGEVDRHLEYRRPDVMLFIDYPGLNFVLASRGRWRRIPTMWYIPPQMWAWASFRVKKAARRLTRLACVFPFTVDFYRRHGVDAHFVGHPLVDHFHGMQLDASAVEAARPRDGEKVLLLLPGSRPSEIEALMPRYLDVVRHVVREVPRVRLLVACLNERHAAMCEDALQSAPEVGAEIIVGKTNEAMSVADLALAASGTATLELAMFGTPMIATYPVNWLQYQTMGRWLISTPYLSLPNAVAQREVIPEFYLHWGGPEPIAREAIDLLSNRDRAARMREDLRKLREKLGEPGASDRAATLALELVGREVAPLPWWRFGLHI